MHARAAVVPVSDRQTTAPRRRLSRSLAVVASAALCLGAVAVGGMPAAADVGSGGYEQAFSNFRNAPVNDVAVDSYTAQVFASRAGAVDIIDENSGAVTATVPVAGNANPELDVDPSRALVWVLDFGHGTLSRIDERTNAVTGSVTIPGDVRSLAVDRTTGKVFVTTGANGTVVPVDESTLALGAAIPVGGTATRVGVDATTGTLYVVDAAGHSVSIVDEATATVSGTAAVPANVVAIAVDSAHHKAYVGSSSVTALTVVDGVAHTASTIPISLGTESVGVTSLGIDPSTQTVFGVNGIQIFRVDTGTGAVTVWNANATPTGPNIAVDVFSNTAIYANGEWVLAQWEPVSILGSASGVVAAGAPYSQTLSAYTNPGSAAFSVTGGALPAGLALHGDTISGTATTPGAYTFQLTATNVGYGDTVTQTYSLRVVTVDRTSGADRFATSVEVSKASYPDPSAVGTVYVANGLSFPDALSGGPAAAQDSGPLLLTGQGTLPASVSAEITRLHPAHIVVVGGPAVVGDSVFAALKALSPDVQRVYGQDRFLTSQAVVRHSFTSAPTVYVSTGMNFPDSLSAGGAAGSLHAPLLLVNGGATSVDSATVSLLQSLHTSNIVIIGGSSVMSPALVSDFARYGTVTQLAGANRFDSSQQVVESAFTNSSHVILANGMNFPDALSASAWAGKTSSPLFITTASCVPQRTLDDIYFLGATDITLIGGTSALASSVAGLTSCDEVPSVIAPTYPSFAPTAAKTGASSGGRLAFDHPVDPSLPVNPRTHH